MGHSVILPQDEAAPFIGPNGIDPGGIAEQCYQQVVKCDVMIVVLDGADSDSGTSLEAGIKVGHNRATEQRSKIVGVRTDFRASEDGQLNAMFRLLDEVILFPSVNEDIVALCARLNDAIRRVCE